MTRSFTRGAEGALLDVDAAITTAILADAA
jgi:hypothetical protein